MPTSTLPEPPPAADLADPALASASPSAIPEVPACSLEPPAPSSTPSHLRRPLPLWVRVAVLVVGWLVLLIGVAGLVLPGIQGIATILAGLAILSVSSELAHRWMYQALRRWPKLWCRVDRFREKIHNWLHRMVHKETAQAGPPPGGGG